MTLLLKSKIKITPIYEEPIDNKIVRTLSYDQEPHEDNIYVVEDFNGTDYSVSLNDRMMRFSIYYTDKWYYITHDSITKQYTHLWIAKECLIEVL